MNAVIGSDIPELRRSRTLAWWVAMAVCGVGPDRTSPQGEGDSRAVGGGSGREIVFIDARVLEREDSLKMVPRGAEVVILDRELDGVSQITESLREPEAISVVHLVASEHRGVMYVGGSALTGANLVARLVSVTRTLPDADFRLYGCDFTSTERGRELWEAWVALVGAQRVVDMGTEF